MLTIEGLSKSFAGPRSRRVLNDIELVLGAGEYIAIMGESGVGKSTLLNLIAGLDLPDAGHITLDGTLMTALDERARTLVRRKHIGFVFQAFHLLPHLTVAQNAALPLALNGVPAPDGAARVAAALHAVALSHAARSYPRQLSGGEMQRAAIARAIVHRPRLLLADEPTGNLDAESATLVLKMLRSEVGQSGGSGILVTHSASAARTADRVYVLTAAGLQAKPPG